MDLFQKSGHAIISEPVFANHSFEQFAYIDTEDTILDDLIIVTDNGKVGAATSQLDNFSNISQSRNSLYEAIDAMCEDARISAAVDIYTSVACEPNDQGHIVWATAADERINHYINYLLEVFNVDKYAYQ